MSEKDKKFYHDLKADPVRYAADLERKRRERKARPEYQRDRKRYWRANNPEALARIRSAGHAVEKALKNGSLSKPRRCARCDKPRTLEAHHHKGYSPEHWLDVRWLCSTCHAIEDGR